MDKFDNFLSRLFLDKFPPLPPGLKDGLIRVLPWLFLIFGALGLFAVLSAAVSFSFAGMMAMGMGQVLGMSIPALGFFMIYIFTPFTQLLSIAGGYFMLKRQLRGWQYALLATILSLFTHILYLSAVGLLLDIVFLYILYQIRDRYAS